MMISLCLGRISYHTWLLPYMGLSDNTVSEKEAQDDHEFWGIAYIAHFQLVAQSSTRQNSSHRSLPRPEPSSLA